MAKRPYTNIHDAGTKTQQHHHQHGRKSFFGLFKRGMKGTYQHCGPQHLQRYLDEFDFRYNNRIALGVGDAERASRAIKGAAGKRLTYRQSSSAQSA